MPRELVDTGIDKRYVRRNEHGRSSAQDQNRDSRTTPKKGEGDAGDR